MADGRDHRYLAGGDRTHDRFIAESCQVFDRTAAAGENQQVGAGHRPVRSAGIEALDRGHDFTRAGFALNGGGPDQDMAGKAVAEPVQDVADHRPAR